MSEKTTQYSVLMSVYQKENSVFLRRSMQSIYDQTIPTNDFVLICDGPLTEKLDTVIEEMQKKFGERLRVIRRNKNYGLGAALRIGLAECKNGFVARMDSDDYSVEDRCEKELMILKRNPNISVVGSIVAEFVATPDDSRTLRVVPETPEQIKQFAKFRSPMNHPSVMFRKKDIFEVGGYPDVRNCQDYYLWEELLAAGKSLYNIQEPLVYMQEDKNAFRRRSGIKYFRIQKKLFKKMRKDGLLSTLEYCGVICLRFGSAIVPNWLRSWLFTKIVRKEMK